MEKGSKLDGLRKRDVSIMADSLIAATRMQNYFVKPFTDFKKPRKRFTRREVFEMGLAIFHNRMQIEINKAIKEDEDEPTDDIHCVEG